MKRFSLGFIALALATSTTAQAQTTGLTMKAWCADMPDATAMTTKSPLTAEGGLCSGFIWGVIDYMNLYQASSNQHIFCPPIGATSGQEIEIVRSWMGRHPERLNFGGSLVITEALMEAFPCAK